MNTKAMLAGAAAAAVFGAVAGVLLAPQSGKKTRRDISGMLAGFYKFVGPEMKKIKNMSRKEYENLVSKALKKYAKLKRLSAAEEAALKVQAWNAWGHIKKHL